MTLTAEHLGALESLGYKREESAFLYRVAIHSGYFTHGQFLSFAGTKAGYFSHDLIRKLLERKHADYQTYRSGARVYHLFGRHVYQAIGRDNLRTRRRHGLEYIKTRLVALDFILEYREHAYLETESEKIPFFENVLGITRKILPVKRYRSDRSREVTPRYFVDRFPLFVSEGAAPTPKVTFTYVDAGSVTVLGFKTHLLAYADLLRTIPEFEFLFIAPTPRLFRSAEYEFYDIFFARQGQVSATHLLKYFRIRLAWDTQKPVASGDVLFLSEAKARYTDKIFDLLYADWQLGRVQDADVYERLKGFSKARGGIFRAVTCGASLSIFSKPSHKGPESCIAKSSDDAEQLSGQVSES
jgi:hypothetical protein